MTNNFKHSTSIEQYLAKEMTATERTVFEKELKVNPLLAQELKIAQHIDFSLMQDDVIDLRKKVLTAMKAGNTQQQPNVPVRKLYTHKWWYAAASFILIGTISAVLFFQTGQSVSNESLFNKYYSSENIIDITRGDDNIVEAVIKFQQKDFALASELFKRILAKDNSNIAVWFYYGISNIETGNYENSIKAFNTIINQNDNLYIEHAEWYLGLCFLKNNQVNKAVDQFQLIASDPDNFHRQEAKTILEKINTK